MNSTSPPSLCNAGRIVSSTASILSRAVTLTPVNSPETLALCPVTDMLESTAPAPLRSTARRRKILCHNELCLHLSRNRLGLREQQQVVRPACLRVRARHVEAAER